MAVMQLNKQNFEAEVLHSKKTVLVDFWAPWCGPCKMVSPLVEELAGEVPEDVKVGKVNVDEEPELAARYGVMSIPTFLVVREGNVINQAVGSKSKQELLGLLS